MGDYVDNELSLHNLGYIKRYPLLAS
uniref:Uncharacterized protein n=1 Tax=Arundo donax TaxID=35708 RepID=A0A0A9FUM6_ARUDO